MDIQNAKPENEKRNYNEIRIICSICGKTFANKYTLSSHIKVMHNEINKIYTVRNQESEVDNKNRKASSCYICWRVFESKRTLKIHIKNCHNVQ